MCMNMRTFCYNVDMQKNIQQLLCDYKRQNHVTNEYIAKMCGVNTSTASRWCNGSTRRIPEATLKRIAQMLGIEPEDLTRVEGFRLERPLLGSVKAGYGLLADENLEGYIPVSEDDYSRGDFFLRVQGDSMKDAHIYDGMLLYVQQASDAPSGSIAVVMIGDEEITVKKLIKHPSYWILQAANTEVEPRIFTLEDIQTLPVRVVGKVVYARMEFD